MRTLTIIAAVLTISIAPLGLLLAGNLITTQLAEPTKGRNVQESIIQAPPRSEQNMVAVPPEGNAPIKPPRPDIILPPPKLPEAQPPQPAIVAQPPQQPVQRPQIPHIQQVGGIEARPRGYLFKGTMVSLQRAQWEGEWRGREGDVVRAQLTDADLAQFLQIKGLHRDANRTMSLKQAFEEIDVRTRDILSQCSPADREIGGCPERPTMYLELDENRTVTLVNLVNPDLSSGLWFRERSLPNGTLERYWGSVITFNGIRYLVSIGTVWAPG